MLSRADVKIGHYTGKKTPGERHGVRRRGRGESQDAGLSPRGGRVESPQGRARPGATGEEPKKGHNIPCPYRRAS
jgi:hypothetical protein